MSENEWKINADLLEYQANWLNLTVNTKPHFFKLMPFVFAIIIVQAQKDTETRQNQSIIKICRCEAKTLFKSVSMCANSMLGKGSLKHCSCSLVVYIGSLFKTKL